VQPARRPERAVAPLRMRALFSPSGMTHDARAFGGESSTPTRLQASLVLLTTAPPHNPKPILRLRTCTRKKGLELLGELAARGKTHARLAGGRCHMQGFCGLVTVRGQFSPGHYPASLTPGMH
jgi:hypothetical protein